MTRPRPQPRLGLWAVLLAAVLTLAACGGDAEPEIPPVAVDPALVPDGVDSGPVRFFENTDESTIDAFANAGETSLMADGRLWEVRRAERLVGTLQVTTLLPDIDLTDEGRRSNIVRGVMPGPVIRIRIDDVEVHALELADRAQYVWFGREVVQVLTVRSEETVVPEDVLRGILAHQRRQPAWNPLPVTLDDRRA